MDSKLKYIEKVQWGLRWYDHYIDEEIGQDILVHINKKGFKTTVKFNINGSKEENDEIAKDVIRMLYF